MALVVKNLPANAGDARDTGSIPVEKIPWSRKWHPTPVFLPGKFDRFRSLAGYSPLGCKESGTAEQLSTCVYIHVCSFPDFFTLYIIQVIEYSSLFHIVGPCSLFVLYIIMCIC